MPIIRNLLTPLLATTAIAAAVAAAPAAAAANVPTCVNVGSSTTQCQSPGNTQIDDSPPIQYPNQYPYFLGGLGVYHHGNRR